jgi:RNA 2',3'-cyclic 3'-phosphodiesterase
MPADEGERWRVFLAIEVPNAVREALREPVAALHPLSGSMRINPVERLHLTLHFLGHLPRADLEHLQPALVEVVARHQRFGVAARGIGAFPGLNRPQVLWAGIDGDDLGRLMALQTALGGALRATGLPVEDRFHPHLTLARARRTPRVEERKLLRDWSARWDAVPFGDVPVDAVHLMRSQLGAGPPRYTTLATIPLTIGPLRNAPIAQPG